MNSLCNFFLLLCITLCILPSCVHASLRELNVGLAELLCNSSCSFFNPLIWENEMVPADDDDVLILYTASANWPLTLNLDVPIALNNMDIEGSVALYVSASSLAVKTVKLIGVDYTSQLQINNSDVSIRSLVVNSADFLSSYSNVTLDYFLATNESSVALVDTDFFCTTCHLGDTSVDRQSTFTAVTATLWTPQANFAGFTNITNLVVESVATLFYAYLANVTIQVNANIFAHGILEVGQVTLMELAMLTAYNTSYLSIAPSYSSRVSGPGSFVFKRTSKFSFGNPGTFLDLTTCEIELFDGNIGTFTNVAFGTLLVNAPDSVILLELNGVTFTLPTILFGNITASGLNILKALTVLGPVLCEGGTTSVNGQLLSTQFEQIGGILELSGILSADGLLNLNSVNFTIKSPSKINGNVLFNNSTIQIYQPLQVFGAWISDASTEIILPALSPDLPPRLNVSGNIDINSTVTFAISETPSSRSEYPLFTYTGTLKGTFMSNFSTPGPANGDFTLEYTDGTVTLVYTPHHKKPHFLKPSLPLFGAIAAVTVLLIVLIIGAFIVKRLFAKRHEYKSIPS